MQLYIANVSLQNVTFCFRVPEENGIKQVSIRPGAQQMIYSRNLTEAQMNAIIEQGRIYGLVAHNEVDRAREKSPMVFSVGKEVPFSKIQHMMMNNHGALSKEGETTRKLAAISAHAAIEAPNSDIDLAKQADVEIIEQPTKRGEAVTVEERMRVPSEKYRVAPSDVSVTRGKRARAN